MSNKLRIGLLIDSFSVPAWAYKMIEILSISNHSEIVLMVRIEPVKTIKQPLFNSFWNQRKNLVYFLNEKFEGKFHSVGQDAFERKDITHLLKCKNILIKSKGIKFNHCFLEKDVDEIRSENIDVLIRIGDDEILRGDILKSSKYGVWSFYHGDDEANRGFSGGLWEVLEQVDQTGVVIKKLSEDRDKSQKLAKTFSQTDKTSVRRSKNNLYWRSLYLVPKKLDELYRLESEEFFENVERDNASPYFYYNELRRTPKNREMLKGLCAMYSYKLKDKINSYFYFDQWVLLFKLEKTKKISTSFYQFKKILPPKDRFWADPFIVEKNEKYYIFLEELLYSNNLGRIIVIEMDQDGNYEEPKVVLEKGYHLSYPFMFEDNNELYMIPETAKNKTIELYKCERFPDKWKKVQVLKDNVYAVDTTIFRKDNKYWMFCNIKENVKASSYDQLFLYYSDTLVTDKWIPHPLNPVVSDVKSSRPAGNIFVKNDKIFRPTQNCSKRYGHGMKIKEIVEMDEKKYHEVESQSIYPNWEKDVLGTHTINHSGRLTIIDALIKRRK